MLIVEGPDMVGKTTFLNAVADRITPMVEGLARDHFTHLDTEMTPAKYMRRFKPFCLSDRGHMSNLVYGHICREGSDLTADQYRVVDGLMLAAGGMMVLLSASADWYEHLLEANKRDQKWNPVLNRKVADAFRGIQSRQPFHGVRPWVDVAYLCDGSFPSQDEALVVAVADRYLSLMAAL